MFRYFSVLMSIFVAIVAIGCTDDPAEDGKNNATSSGCEGECTLGDRSCIDDNTVQFCVPGQGDECNTLVDTNCLTSEQCVQGTCDEIPRECEDVCVDLETRCTLGGQVETCADHDGDGCVEFGDPVDCDTGEFCEPGSGLCRASDCTDQCQQSETSCEGDLIATCIENAEGCLDFGPAKECGEGQTCMNGDCIASTSCENECEGTATVCTVDGSVRTCGDFDDDSCRELGEPETCPAGQVCSEGTCIEEPTCTDACVAGQSTCVGNQIAECVQAASGCLEFTNPSDCPSAGESCTVDGGQAACRATPITGPVVINEVFYDAIGDDVRTGGSPMFIELKGPAGLDISAYVVEMINGSNGSTYNSATLPAGARLDGSGFAVLTLDNPDTYLGLVAGLYTNVYDVVTPYASGQDGLQNGSDNVRLLDDAGVELDAVGYGAFSGNEVFAGEGSPALDPTISGRSIGRVGGADTDDNSADFVSWYPTPGLENADLVINEIYVNQPGVDDGSETFVELVAPIVGWEDFDLSGYLLRAVNGFDGSNYIPANFPGIEMQFIGIPVNLNDEQDGYVVICNGDVAAPPLFSECTVSFDGVDFQNGPDNFVLEYRPENRVIDAVGYGSFSGNEVFVGEGSPAPYTSSDSGFALARWPIGDPTRDVDTDDNATDFSKVSPTPGRENPRP